MEATGLGGTVLLFVRKCPCALGSVIGSGLALESILGSIISIPRGRGRCSFKCIKCYCDGTTKSIVFFLPGMILANRRGRRGNSSAVFNTSPRRVVSFRSRAMGGGFARRKYGRCGRFLSALSV